MGRCNICGQVNGHAEGCPNGGSSFKNEFGIKRGEIRCPICGTMNPVGSNKCRSCYALLDGATIKENHSPQYSNGSGQTSNMRQPTIKEEDSEVVSNEPSTCPKCGYVLRPGVVMCPICKATLQEKPDSNRNKTVPGWEIENQTPTFQIGICDANGNISSPKEYTTQDIKLGRGDLYEDDKHISREHIHIMNEGGKWYVEDISSTHQTFLALKNKTQIEDGDVLVIGNRFFKFETKK